jgi:hypothetical protein
VRTWYLVGLIAAGLSGGCGGNANTINSAPLSEEEKRKIAEQDKQIDAEESPGNRTMKAKPGKR